MIEHTKTPFGLCLKFNVSCIDADDGGGCKSTKCRIASWNNSHSEPIAANITTAPEYDDGVYIQLFAVKDGKRYDLKVITLKELSTVLTNGLMDGLEKVIKD